jgi:prepilin-type N-terminal cleavage/methylation domain-containing protein
VNALRCRRGTTLIEMLTVLVILTVTAGVVVVSLRSLADSRGEETTETRVAAARRKALAERRAVTLTVETPAGAAEITALPDGRVLADSALGFDPLTGRPRARPE